MTGLRAFTTCTGSFRPALLRGQGLPEPNRPEPGGMFNAFFGVDGASGEMDYAVDRFKVSGAPRSRLACALKDCVIAQTGDAVIKVRGGEGQDDRTILIGGAGFFVHDVHCAETPRAPGPYNDIDVINYSQPASEEGPAFLWY